MQLEVASRPLHTKAFRGANTSSRVLLCSPLCSRAGRRQAVMAQGIVQLSSTGVEYTHRGAAAMVEGPRLVSSDSISRRLFRTAILGDWEVVAAMIASGADVNQPVTTWGHTLLHFAAQGAFFRAADRSAVVVRALLDAGADTDAADVNGNTPLHAAATAGWSACYVEGMRTLMAAGADVQRTNTAGLTALHIAAEKGRAEAVKALLEGGAPLGALTPAGETAEELSRRHGHELVAEYLRQAAVRSLHAPV